MSDLQVNPGSPAGPKLRALSRGGPLLLPISGIDVGGAAGEAILGDANPMPVKMMAGGATAANQASANALATAILSALTGTLSVAVVSGGAGGGSSGGLTNTELRASALPVSAASLPLPAGAATETTLAAVNTKLGNPLAVTATALPLPTGASTETTLAAINTKLAGTLTVANPTAAGLTDTQLRASALPVSLASQPLPTGSSTSAKQDTGNTSLASIDTKTPAIGVQGSAASRSTTGAVDTATGTLGAQGAAVVVATPGASTTVFQLSGTWVGTVTFESSNDGFATFQPVAAVYLGGLASQASSWSANGFYSVLTAGFTQVRARMTAYTSGSATATGHSTVGNRIAVALQGNPANLQATVTQGPAGASPWLVALPTGASTEATLSTISTAIANIYGRTPAYGQTTMSASSPVVLPSDQVVAVQGSAATASGSITTQNLVPAGAATAGSAVAVTLSNASLGAVTLAVQVTGTYTGALSLQVTVDGTNWITIGGVPFVNVNTGANSATIASATVGIFHAGVESFAQARITGLAAMTGTATVTLRATSAPALVGLDTALPAGTNSIGNIGTVTTVSGATLAAGTNHAGGFDLRMLATTNGYSRSRIVAAASTNGTVIKATAGRLVRFRFWNRSAGIRYIRFYNAASVTVGTTTTAMGPYPIPAGGSLADDFTDGGEFFSTGICMSITGAAGDTDTTAVTAGDVDGFYSWI